MEPKAKKSLGQNFLKDQRSLEKIADAGEIKAGEVVLEVGPGHGELTRKLLEHNARVIAVEKDAALAQNLKETFATDISDGTLTIVEGDILELDLGRDVFNDTGSQQYKVVANIPYYITGQLIRSFLTADHQPSHMVLLIQKEVAERVVAKNGKESLLSLSVKAYGTPKLVGTVKKGAFRPTPKVDSAILMIKDISRDRFTDVDERMFFNLLHTSFAEKRKQVFPKLRRTFPELSEEVLTDCGLERTVRAEDISLEQFLCIAHQI